MKELSIEEKARRYDEAIEKGKQIQNTPYTAHWDTMKEVVEHLLPELKEDEDGKIRKSIIKLLQVGGYMSDEDKAKAFAWLEKQGQVKEPTISQYENKMCLISKDERIRAQLIEFFSGYNTDEEWWGSITEKDILTWLEKQGEPKEINPSEFDSQLNILLKQFKSLPKEDLASSLSFYLNVVQNDGTYKEEKQGEQKPADKVEPKFKVGDKIYLKPEYRMPDDDTPIANTVKEIRRIDDKYYRFDRSYIFIEDQDKYELVEQKPAEWSEEDEKILSNIIKDLVHPWNEYIPDRIEDEIKWLKNKLKSLRPQSHWKPNDKQMELIKDIVFKDRQKITRKELAIFHSIYNDLKKLKE